MPSVRPLKLVNAQMQVLRARLRSLDRDEIRERLRDVRGLGFARHPAVIDLSETAASELTAADWGPILDEFRTVGLEPVAWTGVERSELPAIARWAPQLAYVEASSLGLRGNGAVGRAEGRGGGAVAAEDGPATAVWSPPLVIDRQVRSGQQIYGRQRDVVVLAAVSAGAEVIADGNVTCYGPLRGRAIAGASGKADAFIHALDFRPELVAVAGLYMTFESGPPDMPRGRIVQVRLDSAGDRLVLDPI